MDNIQTGKLIAELDIETCKKQLSFKQKLNILFATLLGLGLGGVLGFIAYYQRWLG